MRQAFPELGLLSESVYITTAPPWWETQLCPDDARSGFRIWEGLPSAGAQAVRQLSGTVPEYLASRGPEPMEERTRSGPPMCEEETLRDLEHQSTSCPWRADGGATTTSLGN